MTELCAFTILKPKQETLSILSPLQLKDILSLWHFEFKELIGVQMVTVKLGGHVSIRVDFSGALFPLPSFVFHQILLKLSWYFPTKYKIRNIFSSIIKVHFVLFINPFSKDQF